MASVKKVGGKHCVTHSTTGAVLKRGGKPVCFDIHAKAQAEAARTRCRVMGVCPDKK